VRESRARSEGIASTCPQKALSPIKAGDKRSNAMGRRYLCLKDLEMKKIKINSIKILTTLKTISKEM
jgi:hypothetical protein